VSLVTPLNRVLGLGSAKEGVEHWWVQRLSAVALVVLGLWFVLGLASLEDLDYATVVDWLQDPVTSILMILTVLTAVYHSKLGVQVVVEDYVHSPALKVSTLVLSTFVHIAAAVAGVFAVLRIALGAIG
jgi:succinate dehydrogenase / fumarate reductase membrane anchor subunit